MWFWYFMLACDLLVPLAMIIGGRVIWKHSSRKISSSSGYRTPRSIKNVDTWKFANEYCGQLWWKAGWIMLPFSFALHLPFYKSSEGVVGTVSIILCIVQCTVMLLTILPTELALKGTFTDEGLPREKVGVCK